MYLFIQHLGYSLFKLSNNCISKIILFTKNYVSKTCNYFCFGLFCFGFFEKLLIIFNPTIMDLYRCLILLLILNIIYVDY